MYRACLYCAGLFESNALFEELPFGLQVAFDAAQGRLWVICRSCGKWNLVPFDQRLEAIDACEREFRATRTRHSTDNIGLARHGSGVALIRIGRPLRPEFAAWRYGERLGARRRARRARSFDSLGVVNWLLTAMSQDAFASLGLRDVTQGALRAGYRHCALRDPWTDQLVDVPYAALVQSTLVAEDASRWHLEIPYQTGLERHIGQDGASFASIRDVPSLGLFGGGALLPTLGRVLPALGDAADDNTVGDAVHLIESAPEPSRLLAYVLGRPARFATERSYPLATIPAPVRLAIEMAAHEETEQRAMDGELRLLERQWRDAEVLAAIADRLALGG